MINVESACCGQEKELGVQIITDLKLLAKKVLRSDNIIDYWIDYKWPHYYDSKPMVLCFMPLSVIH
jgi:hypothetical protein